MSSRRSVLAALVLLGTSHCGSRTAAPTPTPTATPTAIAAPTPGAPDMSEVAVSPAMRVTVERALFELPSAPGFLIHVRVENRTDKRLGIALDRKFDGVYLNQWGASDERRRGAIDERRFLRLQDAGTQPWVAALHAAYAAGSLRFIEPARSLDYYVEFGAAGGRAHVEQQTSGHAFVWLSLDGGIRATDGDHTFETPDLADHEVWLDVPVQWGTVPRDARVLLGNP